MLNSNLHTIMYKLVGMYLLLVQQDVEKVLQNIIEYAKKKKEVGVTASTGCAAILLPGGTTLHSYLGIGIANDNAINLAAAIPYLVAQRLQQLNVLIIDEISMIDDVLFSKISRVLSLVRHNDAPFGGVQVILVGDFFQLQPVQNTYCFKSMEWTRLNLYTIELTQNMRQQHDTCFQKILSELKIGVCSDTTLEILQNCKTKFDKIEPTILYSKNKNVHSINAAHFTKLINAGNASKTYNTHYSQNARSWFMQLKLPEHVDICIGAQVMVTYNICVTTGLINGTRGVVVELGSYGVTINTKYGLRAITFVTLNAPQNNDIYITFMPLKLAYAMTIHKAQGATLDACVLDLGNDIFACGQAYVALSRVRSLDCCTINSVKKTSFKAHKDVISFYATLNSQA